MTAIPVSKRGTITLPPDMRRKLGLDAAENPMMLVELRDGGIFLQPAEAVVVREIPEETLRTWIAEDEKDARKFWTKSAPRISSIKTPTGFGIKARGWSVATTPGLGIDKDYQPQRGCVMGCVIKRQTHPVGGRNPGGVGNSQTGPDPG